MQKLFVIKIGGNVIDDPVRLGKFLTDLSQINYPKILIHGGGKAASKLAERLGFSPAMVDGRRITDSETLKITVMMYAGLLNKEIVAKLQSLNVNALGLSGCDLNIIRASKRAVGDIDFGFVGDLFDGSVNANSLKLLLDGGIVPVFSAITHNGKGQLLNTNADTIASSVAAALSGLYDVQLNFCFEKRGVLSDPGNDASVIPSMTRTGYRRLLRTGKISKGMIPKLDNGFSAIGAGVGKVVIAHSDELLNTLVNEDTGTSLIN
jgi:acetylglutamate kinase